MRFNRLNNRINDQWHHWPGLSDHGSGEFRGKPPVNISTIQAALREITNGGADVYLIMQIIDHLVGDGIQNPACWPNDK